MSMTIPEAFALPDEFVVDGLCGLCGNTGIVDTIGKVTSPAGVSCGVRAPCLCANGRVQKHHAKVDAPPGSFWVSWNDYSKAVNPALGPKVVDCWETGWSGDDEYVTRVAWVLATTAAEVIAIVDEAYPCNGEREWRFMNPKPADFDPTASGRFRLSKEGAAKLIKLRQQLKLGKFRAQLRKPTEIP